MTVVIEVLQMDRSISRRVNPFYNTCCACATKERALQYMRDKQAEFKRVGIISHFENDTLIVDLDRGYNIGKRSYITQETVLYGTDLSTSVFNLIRRTGGYMQYQDKPYRYDDLGWFTSPYWAKQTHEWKALRRVTRKGRNRFETELELEALAPYESTDITPKLFIKEYELLRA